MRKVGYHDSSSSSSSSSIKNSYHSMRKEKLKREKCKSGVMIPVVGSLESLHTGYKMIHSFLKSLPLPGPGWETLIYHLMDPN